MGAVRRSRGKRNHGGSLVWLEQTFRYIKRTKQRLVSKKRCPNELGGFHDEGLKSMVGWS